MISRRDFLFNGAAVITAGALAPNFLLRTAAAAEAGTLLPGADPDTVLVLLQMAGGNDGLNTVIPWADTWYREHRKRIALPEDGLNKLSDEIALHPALAPLAGLYEQKQLAVIQGVGYPKPNRSHFVATDIWQTGSPDNPVGTGWIGRYNDSALGHDDRPFKAIALGGDQPGVFKSVNSPAPTLRDLDAFRVFPRESSGQRADDLKVFEALHQGDGALARAQLLSDHTLGAYASSENLRKVVGQYRTKVNYPNTGLGRQLRLIGQMIASPLQVKTYHAAIGGFDTHANQLPGHAARLKEIADAVLAFTQDLEEMGKANKVMLMTYSEFGRRVKENGSAGTDHGAASCMFVVGRNVQAGIHGAHPSLEPEMLDRGDLQWHTDFRSVYGALLQDWLGADPRHVLGKSAPQPLGLVNATA